MGCQVYPSRKLLHCKDHCVVGEQLWKRKRTSTDIYGSTQKQLGMLKLTWLFQLVRAYSAPYFPPEIWYLYDQKLSEIDRHLNQGEAEKQLHRKKNIPRWTHENMELLTLDRKHLERCRFTACPVFKVQRDFENWRGVRSLLYVFWKWSQRTRNIAWLTKTALSSSTQKGERFAYELLYTEAIFLNKVLSKPKLPRCWLAEKNFTDPQMFLYDGGNQKNDSVHRLSPAFPSYLDFILSHPHPTLQKHLCCQTSENTAVSSIIHELFPRMMNWTGIKIQLLNSDEMLTARVPV